MNKASNLLAVTCDYYLVAHGFAVLNTVDGDTHQPTVLRGQRLWALGWMLANFQMEKKKRKNTNKWKWVSSTQPISAWPLLGSNFPSTWLWQSKHFCLLKALFFSFLQPPIFPSLVTVTSKSLGAPVMPNKWIKVPFISAVTFSTAVGKAIQVFLGKIWLKSSTQGPTTTARQLSSSTRLCTDTAMPPSPLPEHWLSNLTCWLPLEIFFLTFFFFLVPQEVQALSSFWLQVKKNNLVASLLLLRSTPNKEEQGPHICLE